MNLRILELLAEDGRRTVVDLARLLDRAESTVRERLRGLERDGLIRGYRALLDEEALGLAGKAVVRARVDLSRIPRATEALRALPNVTHLWHTSGEWPLTFVLVAPTLRELHAILSEHVARTGIEEVQVDVALGTLLDGEKRLPLTRLLWTEAALKEQ